jgi:hypothetical protein
MAQDSAVTKRENRCHPPPVSIQTRAPDGEHAAMHHDEAPGGEAPVDCAWRQPQREDLWPAHDAVLKLSESGNGPVCGVESTHTVD